MLASIKNGLSRNPVAHRLLLEWSVHRQKRRHEFFYQKLARAGMNVIPARDLRFQKTDERSVCHIIGSGWSLLDSLSLATAKDAFVVGFNNAALCGLSFDAYFVEFAGRGISDLTEQQSQIAKQLLDKKTELYFKNVYQPHNDINSIVERYAGSAKIVRDVVLNYYPDSSPRVLVEALFAKDDGYLRQYITTAFACMAIAMHSGYSTIVVHGLDFSGNYFYEEPSYSGRRDLLPPATGGYYVKSSKDVPHNTQTRPMNVSALLPYVRDYLESNNIKIYCGSQKSPAAKILPVYGLA